VSYLDDSGQVLDLPPNRSDFSYRCDFGGQKHLAFDPAGPSNSNLTGRKERPFRSGVRSESVLLAWLLMASAPLPRKIQSRGNRQEKRMKFFHGIPY
jgi:hypothetical protein